MKAFRRWPYLWMLMLGACQAPPIALNDQTQVVVHSGNLLQYQFRKWSSVGYDANYKIENERIVTFIKQDVRLESNNNPQSMTGGDDAIGSFVFKALQPGESKLIFQHLYRGEVEKKVTILVKVALPEASFAP